MVQVFTLMGVEFWIWELNKLHLTDLS